VDIFNDEWSFDIKHRCVTQWVKWVTTDHENCYGSQGKNRYFLIRWILVDLVIHGQGLFQSRRANTVFSSGTCLDMPASHSMELWNLINLISRDNSAYVGHMLQWK